MDTLASQWLVDTEWLAKHLDAPDLVVLDASLHLPTTGRDARAEYLQASVNELWAINKAHAPEL